MNTISTITPVFNTERYLAQAIESIRAQTVPPSQLIVVDDGSTDRSAQIARSFPEVELHSIAHSGIGAARNRGVRAATGSFLAFLDADDLWFPHTIESLLPPLIADPSLDAVFGGIEHFGSDDCPDHPQDRYFVQSKQGAGRLCGSMLIRASSFRRVGEFEEGPPVDFIGWYLRAQEARLRMTSIEQVVLRRRIHGGNTTLRQRTDLHDGYVEVVRQSLARRRVAQRKAASSDPSVDRPGQASSGGAA